MKKYIFITILGLIGFIVLKNYILSFSINQEIYNIIMALWYVNKPALVILFVMTFVTIVSAKQLFELIVLRKSIGERGKILYKKE